MGQSTSELQFNIPNPDYLDYFAVQMDRSDRFRLILAPQNIVDLTSQTITQTWPIQNIHNVSGFAEIKLAGYPWYSLGSDDLSVKYFICSLLQRYSEIGWHMKCASDLNRQDMDCSVMIFERKEPFNSSVICLSLNGVDRMRVLGPESVVQIVRDVVTTNWPYGLKSERSLGVGYELKMSSYPWTRETSETPTFMNELIRVLYVNGWTFISGIDTQQRSTGLNALYFRSTQPNEFNEGELSSSHFMAVSLKYFDSICFHNSNPEIIQAVQNILPSIWPEGIQKEKFEHNTHKFKLKGYPWQSYGADAVTSRSLLNNLFGLLASKGYEIYGTFDTTYIATKKSTFFFKFTPIFNVPTNFCFSLNSWDRFRVINGNAPIIDSVRAALLAGWHKGIKKEGNYNSSWEFDLHGYPFQTQMAADKVHTCVMILMVFQYMKPLGYQLISSADTSSKQDDGNSFDVHTLFFATK